MTTLIGIDQSEEIIPHPLFIYVCDPRHNLISWHFFECHIVAHSGRRKSNHHDCQTPIFREVPRPLNQEFFRGARARSLNIIELQPCELT